MPRTALVTGGASGLGAASAARLRAEGLTVITLDVSGPADVTADVTDEAALGQVAGQVGPVDVLVNSAGIVGANKPLLETTAQEWRRVLDVNVLGIVNAKRAFVPGMRDQYAPHGCRRAGGPSPSRHRPLGWMTAEGARPPTRLPPDCGTPAVRRQGRL